MSMNPVMNGESSKNTDRQLEEDIRRNIILLNEAIKERKKKTGKKKTSQEFSQMATSMKRTTSLKAKKRKLAINNASEFFEVSQQALENSDIQITEYEAIRINVRKKLEKMESTQAIYAENLINTILRKGLLNQLTPDSVVCDTRLLDILLRGNNIPSTSLTEVSSSPNLVQPNKKKINKIKSEPEH